MKTKTTGIALLAALVAAGILGGCQLVVDFDRTLIDAGTVDAALDVQKPDTSTPDASDGSTPDASDGSTADANDGSTTSDASDGSTADATSDASDAATD